MLDHIFIAYATQRAAPKSEIAARVAALRSFFGKRDEDGYTMYAMQDSCAGALCITPQNLGLDLPLVYCTPQRMTFTMYLPFGATAYVSPPALQSGEYLPQIVDALNAGQASIRHFAPPLVWCDMDLQRHALTLYNDYRGFGRIYEFKSAFGTVWTNKSAAAPLFAGTEAAVDVAAWSELVTLGMFSQQYMGYKNMRLLAPETRVHVDSKTGDIASHTVPPEYFTPFEDLPPNAVEDTANAMYQWHRELNQFSSLPKSLSLSGGRDSRVLAAYAFAVGTSNLQVTSSYPPRQDYELAHKIVQLCGMDIDFTGDHRREVITQRYEADFDLLTNACALLHNSNEDISFFSYLSYCYVPQSAAIDRIHMAGHQGEVTHNCFYTEDLYVKQKDWELHKKSKASPWQRRIERFMEQICTKQVGVAEQTGQVTFESLQKYTDTFRDRGISDFYFLDHMCLSLWVNRQWSGAESIATPKTPLTLYPYVYYGLRQSVESKLQSRFVRDVISTAMPQWRDVPFFHELPPEEINDFAQSYPTYWDFGRADEIAELAVSNRFLWQYFDKRSTLETFIAYRNPENRAHTVKLVEWNRTAQKMLWTVAFYQQVDALNACIREM